MRGENMYNPLLKTFVYVVQKKSFSQAAKQLYVTPASVMKQMNTLEEHLDMQLLIRTHQGIQLTKQGEAIYQEAIKLISHSDEVINRVKTMETKEIIKIGSSFLNPAKEFVDLWNQVPTLFQQYKLKVIPYDDNHQHILRVIEKLGSQFDFLIGTFNSKQIMMKSQYKQLGNHRLCVAVPRGHRLAQYSQMEITDLYGEHLLCVKAGDSEYIDDFRNYICHEHPQIFLEDTDYYYDIDTFNRCEEENCLLLTLDIWEHIHPSLVTIPVAWDFVMPYGLLYAKYPSKDVEHCLKEIENIFKK